MIRLKDLPDDFDVNLERFKDSIASEPVAALLDTIVRRLPNGVDVKLVRTNVFGTEGTNVIFSNSTDGIAVHILDDHEGKFSFAYHKKSFKYALEQLK